MEGQAKRFKKSEESELISEWGIFFHHDAPLQTLCVLINVDVNAM